jgi:hypothetical protein
MPDLSSPVFPPDAWDGEPTLSTKWRAQLAIWACDHFVDDLPAQDDHGQGLYSTGNGDLVIAPTEDAVTGAGATLAVLAQHVGIRELGSGVALPDGSTVEGCAGSPSRLAILVYDPGPWDGAPVEPYVVEHFADARFYQDGMGVTIAVLPADVDLAAMAATLRPPDFVPAEMTGPTTTVPPPRLPLRDEVARNVVLNMAIDREALDPSDIAASLGISGRDVGVGLEASVEGTSSNIVFPALPTTVLRYGSAADAEAMIALVTTALDEEAILTSSADGLAFNWDDDGDPRSTVIGISNDSVVAYRLDLALDTPTAELLLTLAHMAAGAMGS